MAACAALCIGLLPQMAGLSSGGGNSTGAAPASASESQAASSTPAAGAYAAGGESSPLPRSAPAMRAVRKPRTPPRWRRSPPPPSLPSPCRNRERAHRRTSPPLPPPLSEDLAGQLGQSPGRLLLFSTIPEELEDRDWQETDGFRWTALEAEGGPLPAGRPDRPGRRPVGERGGGPRSGSGVSLNLTSALDRARFAPGPGLFSAFFRGRAAFSSFLFHFTSATKKRLSDVHFYDIIANSRSPRHGGFRLGSLYECPNIRRHPQCLPAGPRRERKDRSGGEPALHDRRYRPYGQTRGRQHRLRL